MPYSAIEDLPPGVRHALPEHAQSIYRQAFNHAWERYRDNYEREAIAHRIAWAAVKRTYRKVGSDWTPKEQDAE
jgi:cation transport regulator